MSLGRLSKSARKHIRREKARIRREILDPKKQEEAINQLYEKFGLVDIKNKSKSKIKSKTNEN